MAFKIDDELISMIGDFANMNRLPDFKVKTIENQQKGVKPGIGRQHSLNFIIGVADEIPPFSEVNTGTRRQSTGRIFHSNGAFSSSLNMKDDNGQVQTNHGKLKKLFSSKDKNIGNDELDLKAVREEGTNLLASAFSNGIEESLIERKQTLTNNKANDNFDNDNDDKTVNQAISRSLSLHTNIINNMSHRGSIIFINDDDDNR